MYWDFRILLSHCYAQMKISFPGLIFAQYKSINIIIIIIVMPLKIKLISKPFNRYGPESGK